MVRWLAVVCAAACGKAEDNPARTIQKSIELVEISHPRTWAPIVPLVFRDGQLVAVDAGDVIASHPDARGRLTPAWRTARDVDPSVRPAFVVIADRGTPAHEVRTALIPYASHCIGFMGYKGTDLAMIISSPCPPVVPDRADRENVQLALYFDHGAYRFGLSRLDETQTAMEQTELDRLLHDYKASGFFADRTDLALAVDEGATIGEVIELLAAVYDAGFVGARWLAPEHLPIELANTGLKPEPGSSIDARPASW